MTDQSLQHPVPVMSSHQDPLPAREQKSKVFFPNLDSLRFMAFLLVFLQHGFYNIFSRFEHNNYFTGRLVDTFFLGGGTGVQIFFVLSGFLISYLIIKEIQATGKLNIGNFYLRRTLRIWPLYYATVLFAFVIYPFIKTRIGIHSDLCSRPWYYFSFLANFDLIHIAQTCPGKDAMTQNIVWSVSIEEQFYLFWPLLFFIFPRKMQWMIFPLIIAACMLFRAGATGPVLYFHTLSVMGDLAIGGLFAYLSINNTRFSDFIRNLPRAAILFTYISFIVLYFFRDRIFIFPGNAVVTRMIFDIFWIFIILEQCFAKNALFPLGKIKPFTRFGKISYGLYMLHPVGILMTDIGYRLLHINEAPIPVALLKGIIAFLLSIFIATISYRWLESPFLKIKDRLAIIKTKASD